MIGVSCAAPVGNERLFTGILTDEERPGDYRWVWAHYSSRVTTNSILVAAPALIVRRHPKHSEHDTRMAGGKLKRQHRGSHPGRLFLDVRSNYRTRYCINSVALKFDPESDD